MFLEIIVAMSYMTTYEDYFMSRTKPTNYCKLSFYFIISLSHKSIDDLTSNHAAKKVFEIRSWDPGLVFLPCNGHIISHLEMLTCLSLLISTDPLHMGGTPPLKYCQKKLFL